MVKSLVSAFLLLLKIFLASKVVVWVYYRLNVPGAHPIDEIDWVLVLIILDSWLISHTKIEITGMLKRDDD
jgi:hypothetical protein